MFKRAEDKGIKIDVTERFKDRLVDEGYNPAYGARPLRRAIMRLLEDSMAERMLSGDIKVRAYQCLEGVCLSNLFLHCIHSAYHLRVLL